MAQFINAKENLVTEYIDGFMRASGDSIWRGSMASPISKSLCAAIIAHHGWPVISGGGSGHEPAHAGLSARAC